ncbi:5082_t:CDS:1, partial [Acaulospora colombiana]
AVHGVSSVAIVDKETEPIKLVDNLSASDIKHISIENVADGYRDVSVFLNKIRDHPKMVITCEEDTNLEEITRLALAVGIHRVWVVEKGTKKPLGIVSMSDTLSMFVAVKGDHDQENER